VNTIDLSVFVEFGVGLAGFSGVVVAFGLRSGALNDYDRFRVVLLLFSSLFPAFVGTLPAVLDGFGIFGAAAWRIMGTSLLFGLAAFVVLPFVLRRGMSPDARSNLSPTVWVFGIGGTVVAFVWNGLNLMGWPSPLSLGPVIASMVWLLFQASIMFLRLLLFRIGN
jgi:hypothetical protein